MNAMNCGVSGAFPVDVHPDAVHVRYCFMAPSANRHSAPSFGRKMSFTSCSVASTGDFELKGNLPKPDAVQNCLPAAFKLAFPAPLGIFVMGS